MSEEQQNREEHFLLTPRENDFYENNIGKDVNLYTGSQLTHSGVISSYNREEGRIWLMNYIKRIYDEHGQAHFIESSEEVPIRLETISWPEPSSKGDREGRIKRYNQETVLEDLERDRKFRSIIKNSEDQKKGKQNLIKKIVDCLRWP